MGNRSQLWWQDPAMLSLLRRVVKSLDHQCLILDQNFTKRKIAQLDLYRMRERKRDLRKPNKDRTSANFVEQCSSNSNDTSIATLQRPDPEGGGDDWNGYQVYISGLRRSGTPRQIRRVRPSIQHPASFAEIPGELSRLIRAAPTLGIDQETLEHSSNKKHHFGF